ncbi:uncharacterized protein LOC135466230 [Liolophura sinensis]|uniref:uncharacterized protein LOC135466230 n=1 Tax=Liolophura sinensis TaxID=3198878 RepID=UPI00315838A4
MVEHPFCQPLFSTKMVEELAVLLDDVPNKVWELAEKIKMPACTPIPKFRRERFGGSPTRCVLYFFQCLCKKNSYSKEISLRMLRQILENLELERASDKVKKYQWHQRKEPQEHTDKSFLYEQNHTSRVDTGAFPDSSTCDIAVSPHKTAFSVPSTFTDDTPKGGTSPPSTTDHLPSTTNTVITGLKFKDEEDIYDDASSYTANGATSSSTPGATGLQNEDEGIYEECYLHTDSRTGTANTASTAHLSTLSDGDNTSTMCPRDTKPKGRRTKDSGYGSKLFDEK